MRLLICLLFAAYCGNAFASNSLARLGDFQSSSLGADHGLSALFDHKSTSNGVMEFSYLDDEGNRAELEVKAIDLAPIANSSLEPVPSILDPSKQSFIGFVVQFPLIINSEK